MKHVLIAVVAVLSTLAIPHAVVPVAAVVSATRVWDGAPDGGGSSVDGKWSTATNWVGDATPVAGDDLEFPSSSAQKSVTNDLPAGTTFRSIRMSSPGYSNYQLHGNLVGVTDTIAAVDSIQVYLPVRLDGNATISSTYELFFYDTIDLNGHRVVFNGQGGIGLGGISGTAPSPALTVAMEPAGRVAVLGDGLFAGDTVVSSGTLDTQATLRGALSVSGGTVRAQTVTGPLSATGGAASVRKAGSLLLTSSATLMGSPTEVDGPIQLGNARLALDSSWCAGQCYEGPIHQIITNTGSLAIEGRFSNTTDSDRIDAPFHHVQLAYDRAPGGDVTGRVAPADAQPEPAPPTPPAPPAPVRRQGYWMLGRTGDVYAFGDAGYHGGSSTAFPRVDLEPTPSGHGYWVLNDHGQVTTHGDAQYHGGASALRPFETATAISRSATGSGYWIFTNLGRVFAFGDARFLGDMSATNLNGPVLDAIPTPSGAGYYMVGSDGGIFTFGDAAFHGSMGATKLNAPVQSLVPDLDGVGYWLVASDGGIFAFESEFYGSMGATRLNKPVTGMVGYGNGYLMVGEDGGIFTFGEAPFFGSLGSAPPITPIVSTAVLNQ